MFLIILIISIETLTMRVLITVPTKSGYGGVTNYYLGIKEYWKENIEYFYFGRKPWRNIFYPFLIIRFIIRLICFTFSSIGRVASIQCIVKPRRSMPLNHVICRLAN